MGPIFFSPEADIPGVSGTKLEDEEAAAGAIPEAACCRARLAHASRAATISQHAIGLLGLPLQQSSTACVSVGQGASPAGCRTVLACRVATLTLDRHRVLDELYLIHSKSVRLTPSRFSAFLQA